MGKKKTVIDKKIIKKKKHEINQNNKLNYFQKMKEKKETI